MSATASIDDVLAGLARWCLVLGDCTEILPTLADGCVDHVITDPPYNERTHSRARSLKGGCTDIPIHFAPLVDFGFAVDLLRVSRRWVLCFCAVEDVRAYRDAVGDAAWVRSGVWDRPDGTPQISGDRPGQAAEGIAIMHRADFKKRWNSGGKRGMWRCGVERAERWHATPKPVPLMLELISDFTDPGDIVLDTFVGSATTGIAALRLGRRFIGIDKNAEAVATAAERLAAEENHQPLSAVRAGQIGLWDSRAAR